LIYQCKRVWLSLCDDFSNAININQLNKLKDTLDFGATMVGGYAFVLSFQSTQNPDTHCTVWTTVPVHRMRFNRNIGNQNQTGVGSGFFDCTNCKLYCYIWNMEMDCSSDKPVYLTDKQINSGYTNSRYYTRGMNKLNNNRLL
jgi:hypothetical protein